MNSSRSADFLTPRSPAHALFREAVLDLAEHHAFARPMVNSGRLSVPCTYDGSPLNGEDALAGGPARTRPGAPCPDAPLGDGFLLDRLTSGGFTLMGIRTEVPERLEIEGVEVAGLAIPALDAASTALVERYLGAAEAAVYLIRPDQHVAARWPSHDTGKVAAAVTRAMSKE
jgi:3-(3-hydroxy-phenyl)propionate hydroxylase